MAKAKPSPCAAALSGEAVPASGAVSIDADLDVAMAAAPALAPDMCAYVDDVFHWAEGENGLNFFQAGGGARTATSSTCLNCQVGWFLGRRHG